MAELNKEDIADNSVFDIVKKLTAELQETYKVLEKIKKTGQASGTAIKSATNLDAVKKQIDGLTTAQKKLNDENLKVINSLKAEVEALKNVDKAAKGAGDSTNKLTGLLKKGAGALVAFFAIDKIKSFVSEVIEVTSQFQKFSAVLVNTLGSKSAADQALSNIKKFAAETPYSVAELTGSFVKLANIGFKPTVKELTKLGDLAASQGKSFDQLTEGIIDAQTGQFERLKEFGIRAQKEGDKVSFTFKGVKKQVDFTSDSITDYIVGLGAAEGVTGGMAAISKTLGGQISNLGDSWDTFLATLGEGNSGALSGTVSLLGKALAIATDLVKTTEQSNEEIVNGFANAALEQYKAFTTAKQQEEFKERIFKRQLELQMAIARAGTVNSKLYDIKDSSGKVVKRESDNSRLNDNKIQLAALQKTISLILYLNEELDKENAKSGPKLNKYLDEINARKAEQLKEYQDELDLKKKRKADGDQAVKDLEEQYNAFKIVNQDHQTDELNFLNTTIDLKEEAEEGLTDFELEELKKRVKANKEAEKQKAEDRKRLVSESIQFAGNLISGYYDNLKMQYDKDSTALNEKKEYELQLAGENKDSQKAINKKFDAEDKKLKMQQAEREKKAAIFSILLNTARGITSALASVPPNVPLSIFIGATGALELATAAGLELPAFEKGTKSSPGGWNLVGEKGVELVKTLTGDQFLTPNGPTVMDIPAGSEILTNQETMRQLALAGLNDMGGRQQAPKQNSTVKKLDELIQVTKNKKTFSLNITRQGVEAAMQSASSRTEFLDNFYK